MKCILKESIYKNVMTEREILKMSNPLRRKVSHNISIEEMISPETKILLEYM